MNQDGWYTRIYTISKDDMNPVVHFEFPGKDMERMKEFYSKAFGWKLNQLGPEMGNYVVAHTGETDEKGMIKNPGQINGGFYKASEDPMSQHPSVVIAVQNLEQAIENVKAAGGTIHGEPYDIPGVGKYVSMIDTEGNRVSLLQALQM